uniref:Uncharacterized protein n=1 Tax=Caenorhabditis japonica TaxID=281687 RepID=A0A8R1EKV7_CAEJA
MVHEMEAMMSKNCFTKEFMSGEMQFMNEGYYPTPDLNARLMPQYEMMIEGRSSDSPLENKYTDTKVNAREVSVQNEEEKEVEICLLPEEVEEDDFDEWPAYHMGTRFWAWCRRSFMGKVDTEYLENFKEMILDAYNQEALQKFFVNEPWKYRKKAPPPSSRRRSLNTPSTKSAKRVSIANETLSPQPTTSSVRLANKKALLAGYRIPRSSEKESLNNNNKIVPMIGSMVITACRELRESKPAPDTPLTTRRGRTRLASRENSRERDRKCAKMEIDVNEDVAVALNGSSHRFSPRLHSPRQIKKEKFDEDFDKLENGNTTLNGMTNGHHKTNGSPKRRNGDLRNGFTPSSASKPRKNGESAPEELEMLSDIEDFDAKAIGSRIVAKLIAGGILPESSAQIFEQMTLENDDDGSGVSTKVEMSEEGKEEAEDQDVGELAEELHNLQMSLREEIPAKKALFMLTWRRAKAHFSFFHTFDELRRADYDLFKLGVNTYREYPRKLPGIVEMPVVKESLKKRNLLARKHYSKMYRRQPKYRWHKAHAPSARRVLV